MVDQILLTNGVTFGASISCGRDKDTDGANRIVIAGDHIVNRVGVAVGINNGNDRNAQSLGFGNGDMLFAGIDDKEGSGELGHIFDTTEVALKFDALTVESDDFFFGKFFEGAVFFHLIDVTKTIDALLDGAEVGQCSTQPTMVDEVLIGTHGLFFDDLLCLSLGADKENFFAPGGDVNEEFICFGEKRHRLLKIDDINAVACPKDVGLHTGVPAVGLVSEVNACFEHLSHRKLCHGVAPYRIRLFVRSDLCWLSTHCLDQDILIKR